MSSPYIPRSDAALRNWAVAFAAHLSADPARFGRTVAEAAGVQALVDDFASRLTAASEPPTRTVGTVVAKAGARAAMVTALRRVAQRIRHDGVASAADLRSLGLSPVGGPRTRVAAPTTAPRVVVSVAAPHVHLIRFADASTPNRRAKPAGVVGMQLFVAFTDASGGTSPPPPPREAVHCAFVTRQKKLIAHPPDLNGRVAHYYARWQTRRGELGPWSAVASLMIAGPAPAGRRGAQADS